VFEALREVVRDMILGGARQGEADFAGNPDEVRPSSRDLSTQDEASRRMVPSLMVGQAIGDLGLQVVAGSDDADRMPGEDGCLVDRVQATGRIARGRNYPTGRPGPAPARDALRTSSFKSGKPCDF